MVGTLSLLPADQLHPLRAGYENAVAAKRRTAAIGFAVLIFFILLSAFQAEVDLAKLFDNLFRFTTYIGRLFYLDNGAGVLTDVREWFWGLRPWMRLLAETILIAYVGTLLGFVGGFVMCFLAAQNLIGQAWVRIAARRYLEFCRTVPEIVFALIFVVAFGLGPIPGVLAIAIHTTGALGKLFSEVVENIDMKPVEGLASTGASWLEMVRFAVVPQVLSNFASYALLRFEINVRGASVMGFVGAGGIGQDLLEAVRKFYYSDVSAILLLIIVTVMIIDLLTERLRHALLGMERQP